MRILKEEKEYFGIEKLNEFDKKKYIVAYYGWRQYAEGITGIDYTNLVYIENGKPFDTRDEAKQFALDNKIKTNQKAGKDTGYGPVGGYYYTALITTIDKYIKMASENQGRFIHYGYPSNYAHTIDIES